MPPPNLFLPPPLPARSSEGVNFGGHPPPSLVRIPRSKEDKKLPLVLRPSLKSEKTRKEGRRRNKKVQERRKKPKEHSSLLFAPFHFTEKIKLSVPQKGEKIREERFDNNEAAEATSLFSKCFLWGSSVIIGEFSRSLPSFEGIRPTVHSDPHAPPPIAGHQFSKLRSCSADGCKKY